MRKSNKPKMVWWKKTLLGILVFLVGIIVIAGLSGGNNTSNPEPTVEKVVDEKDPIKYLEGTTNMSFGEGSRLDKDGNLFVRIPKSDSPSVEGISVDLEDRTFEVLKNIKNFSGDYKRVLIQSYDTLTDDYGNESEEMVVRLVYEKATVDKINFDNVDSLKIWELKDNGKVHPALMN